MDEITLKVPGISTNPLDKPHNQLHEIQLPNFTTTHKRYQRSDSEDERILNNNNKLSKTIASKRNSSEKLNKIKELLKEGAHDNFKDANRNNNTPLHLAIKNNELETVNFLLTQGADTTIKNDDGKTPVDLAKELKHKEITAALESHISQTESHLHLNRPHNSEADTHESPRSIRAS
jgi:ankyrin repeat protein